MSFISIKLHLIETRIEMAVAIDIQDQTFLYRADSRILARSKSSSLVGK